MSSKNSALCRSWKMDAPLLDLAVNRRGDWAVGSLGDGSLVVVPTDDAGEDPRVMEAHDGVSLCLAADADDHALMSGGDDGRVLVIDPALAVPEELVVHKGQWIDHVAAGCEGHRAYASGKTLYRLDEEGKQQAAPLTMPSSIGGLSFSPNGKRLAVSHYNGVSLFWAHAPETPAEVLPWNGSHLNLCWTPDSKILLSAMQDTALHGWKLDGVQSKEPGNEMHMQGYESKITSMGFTTGGKYLATSGMAQVVCWPFFDGGPWEKQPLQLGGTDGRVITRVAPHPRDPVVAAGYGDGMLILAPLDGRMEIVIHPPFAAQGAGVVGLVWDGQGNGLLAALENGWLMLFTLASISRFVRGRHG